MRVSLVGVLMFGWVGCAAAQSPANSSGARWVGTWMSSVTKPTGARRDPLEKTGLTKGNMTVRDVVHVSLGGRLIRVRISNEYGSATLKVGAAHVGRSAMVEAPAGAPAEVGTGRATKQDEVVAGTDRALTFAGSGSVEIPAGRDVWSDPVKLDVPLQSSLTVSVYVPLQAIADVTYHLVATSTNFLAPGDQTAAASLAGAIPERSWFFVSGVDVMAPADGRAVVVIGDSISDGNISTVDANRRWPDDLARRLEADAKTKDVAVLNAGVAGGRVLYPQTGPGYVARFEKDALEQDGVKYVIVEGGLNDIVHATMEPDSKQIVTADDILAGLKKLIAMAHAHGVKVYGGTCTPMGGSKNSSPAGEAMRLKVNAWIRSGQGYDAWFDWDKAVRDPAKPDSLRAEFGGERSGHIHMYDVGYQAMADAIDLTKFE
jgi:lysophospholipase L1-like esterase